MTGNLLDRLSDEQIVDQLRGWAKKWQRAGFNPDKANRIDNLELVPRLEVLSARGDASVRKLLALLDDENPEVQLLGATFAYQTIRLAAGAFCSG